MREVNGLAVWKSQLDGHINTLRLPLGSRILHVDVQHGDATIWYLCDPDAPMMERTFSVIPTGQPVVPTDAVFHGTIFFHEGDLVYHVFETFK